MIDLPWLIVVEVWSVLRWFTVVVVVVILVVEVSLVVVEVVICLLVEVVPC